MDSDKRRRTTPGSPCRHTKQMQDNSVKDQYCNAADGVFHQTVFVHDKHCHVSFAQKAFSPQKLTYRADKCTYGYKLQSCTPGACPDAPNDPEHGMDAMIGEIGYIGTDNIRMQ